jgi:hypothetical protein
MSIKLNLYYFIHKQHIIKIMILKIVTKILFVPIAVQIK